MNTLTQEQRQTLYDQYEHKMANEYGFGAPSQWSNGPRNFAAFLASSRIANDLDRALNLITSKLTP
jgi:hypothetical protein